MVTNFKELIISIQLINSKFSFHKNLANKVTVINLSTKFVLLGGEAVTTTFQLGGAGSTPGRGI